MSQEINDKTTVLQFCSAWNVDWERSLPGDRSWLKLIQNWDCASQHNHVINVYNQEKWNFYFSLISDTIFPLGRYHLNQGNFLSHYFHMTEERMESELTSVSKILCKVCNRHFKTKKILKQQLQTSTLSFKFKLPLQTLT